MTTPVQKVTPAAPTAVPAPAPAAKPKRERGPNLTPKQRADVAVGKLVARAAKVRATYGGYSSDIDNALDSTGKWLAATKAAVAALPADFAPAGAAPAAPKEIVAGAKVIFRDKRREAYAAWLKEADAGGLEVQAIHQGGMIRLKVADGSIIVPRAHCKLV